MAGQAYCIMKNCEAKTVYKNIPCKKCRGGEVIKMNDEAINQAKEKWSQWAKENPDKVKN